MHPKLTPTAAAFDLRAVLGVLNCNEFAEERDRRRQRSLFHYEARALAITISALPAEQQQLVCALCEVAIEQAHGPAAIWFQEAFRARTESAGAA